MNKLLPLLLISTLGLLLSCANKDAKREDLSEKNISLETPKMNQSQPQWYYFSSLGIHKANAPAEIPSQSFLPWTEAVRVVQANSVDGTQIFLVNKLGVLSLNANNSALYTEKEFFQALSTGGMYRTEDGYIVRMYRNTFFTSVISQMPFLLHFNPETKFFTPLLTSSDFGFSSSAQGIALDRVGSMWYAAFKEEKDAQVLFSYIEFENFPKKNTSSPILDLSGIRKISSETYQNAVAPFSLESAPEQLKHMLSHVSPDTSWSVTVSSPRFRSAQVYSSRGQEVPLNGSAWISDSYSSLIFEDGTFFLLTGAQDTTITITMPPLSQGYIYTAAIVSGKTIIASWEETRFFETGRAGLLEIQLPDGLY